jgi:thioredoxin-like negative regulator of GroEL
LDRLLLLAGVVLAVSLLVVAARQLARSRLNRARSIRGEEIWQALGTTPDGRPAVVAFSTPSCAACHTAQRPALAQLESRAGGAVRVIEVDAAERPEVARRFGVLTVPTTAILDPTGGVTAMNNGFAPTDRLAAQLGLSLSGEPLRFPPRYSP